MNPAGRAVGTDPVLRLMGGAAAVWEHRGMATGFMSEHSAEFAIAYSASRMAERAGLQMSPVYYWHAREGARHARTLCGTTPVRAVNVFARRPQTGGAVPVGHILIKFNAVLFEAAEAALAAGLPTLAACPLAADLREYRPDVPCAWFSVGASEPGEDLEVVMHVERGTVRQPLPRGVLGPLAEEEIIQAFTTSAQGSFEELQRRIRMSRASLPRGRFGAMGTAYKPITLLFWGPAPAGSQQLRRAKR